MLLSEKQQLVFYSVLFAWLMFFGIFLLTVFLISGCFFVITQLILRGKPSSRRVIISDDPILIAKRNSGRVRPDLNRIANEKKSAGKLLLPFTFETNHRETATSEI